MSNGGNLLGEIAYTCTLTKGVLSRNRNGFKVCQKSDCTIRKKGRGEGRKSNLTDSYWRKGEKGGREEERAGRTWDGGYHDLAEGDADAIEAVGDGRELKCVEARRNVAYHSDVLA